MHEKPLEQAHAEGSEPPGMMQRLAIFAVVSALLVVVAHHLDARVFHAMHWPEVEDEDWYRMLRITGYLPTWLIVALGFILVDWHRRRLEPGFDVLARGVLLALSAGTVGLLAELIKLIIRRERPIMTDGAYVFRSFGDGPLNSSGLGMPSSHAAVAFGAACMLAILHPRLWPVALLIGVGGAMSRLVTGAHFLSDVTASAVLGYASAWLLWRWHLGNVRRRGREDGAAAEGGS